MYLSYLKEKYIMPICVFLGQSLCTKYYMDNMNIRDIKPMKDFGKSDFSYASIENINLKTSTSDK